MTELEIPDKKKITITLGGLPGSGTTTAAKLLSERLGLPWTDAGKVFREMADERGMELNEFGKYAEEHPEVDRELDRRLIALMRKGGIIMEGRLAGANALRNSIPSVRAWLHAPFETRIQRIQNREGGELEAIREHTMEREDSEKKRYLEYYGIDPENPDYYTLTLNSGELLPEPIVGIILEAVREVRWE